MRNGRVWRLSAVLILAASSVAWAQAGGGEVALGKEYTAQDFSRDILTHYRKELGDKYRDSGVHDAKWDAAAKAALDLFATYDTENTVNEVAAPGFEFKATVRDEDLGKAAQKAIDLGCKDPMILYARALALINAGDTRTARPLLDQARASIGGAPYGPIQTSRVYLRHRLLTRDPKVAAAEWPALEKVIEALACGPFPSIAARRDAGTRVYQGLYVLEDKDREAELEQLKAVPGVDPWVLAEVTADLELEMAYGARGTEIARPATPEQWTVHAARARAAAQAAWQLHPDSPEPCIVMMRLGIIDGQGDVGMWFERALAAQPDYAPAYSYRFRSEQPSWGGTVKAVLAEGKKAADSGRFDTSIPWEYIRAACVVAEDRAGGDENAFTRDDVKATCADIIEKYADKYKGTPQWGFFASARAALAIVNKDAPTAKRWLNDIPGDVDSDAFGYFDLASGGAIEDMFLESYPTQPMISRYRQAGNRGNYNNAANFLGQAITRGNASGRDLQILQNLQDCAKLMAHYTEGQVLSLTEESSRPFWRADHPWKIEQGAIVTSGRDGFELSSHFYLRDRHYAIHMEFEFMDVDATEDEFLSLAWGLDAKRVGWNIMLTGSPPHARIGVPVDADADDYRDVPLEVPAKNTLDVVYFDGSPSLKLNGQAISMENAPADVVNKLASNNSLLLGSNAAVRITKMTLQHLDAKP